MRVPGQPGNFGPDEAWDDGKKVLQRALELDPEDVAGVVLLACAQSQKPRIIEVQMRTMAEALA